MLNKITVKNLALISYLELEFGNRLNILSGETGAGKSIIVDSLMLLLGGRYDKSFLKYGEDSGYVEGVFSTPIAGKLLNEIGFDADDAIIVMRKFFADGRNEIRINGKQITTLMLKNFMSRLVDIYGQNEFQSLLRVSEQRRIVDYFLRNSIGNELNELNSAYYEYKTVVKNMLGLGDDDERERNMDILRYQIDEIEKSDIKDGEEENLVTRRKIIMASERIRDSLGEAYIALNSDEHGAIAALSIAENALNSLAEMKSEYSNLAERLKSAIIELSDIEDAVSDELEDAQFDERELDKLEKRLETVRSLKRKYGDYPKMMKFLTKAKEDYFRLEHGAEEYKKLSERAASLEDKMYSLANIISAKRKKGALVMQEEVTRELYELGMEKSVFEIRFENPPERDSFIKNLTPAGYDEFEFYLSPNVGQPLLPLVKIISGGEMSRFMLALKIITSNLDGIETLIFDEIDTGISGAIGQAVAKKLAGLSRNHQVLCVTHLPQIASMADNHYFIKKHTADGNTVTNVTLLNADETIEEIARLSGAKDISSTATKNAAEMKEWSDNYKSLLEKQTGK